MSFYGKVFKFEKQENYEQLVEAFGLPEDRKNFFLNYRPSQRFEKGGDTYTHIIYVNDKEKPVQFKDGEEFDSTVSTTNVKNLYTVDGNTITHVAKFGVDGEIVTTIKKEFADDKMVETITSNNHGISAKRYYSA